MIQRFNYLKDFPFPAIFLVVYLLFLTLSFIIISSEDTFPPQEMLGAWSSQKCQSQPRCDESQPLQPYFKPRPASIAPSSVSYRGPHFLAIPTELRQEIWRTVQHDVTEWPVYAWHEVPYTAYDGLLLTCRQIYYEVSVLWFLVITSRHKMTRFIEQPYSQTQMRALKRLSLEIPFDAEPSYFRAIAKMFSLHRFAEVLEHLQIFFVGRDKFGIHTFVHGCGLYDPSPTTTSSKLAIEGQGHWERQPIFIALCSLFNLRSLVLRNCQYPIQQMMLLHNKRRLTRLHITTDPRSTLHQECQFFSHPHLIFPPTAYFPPVRALEISANATLTSLQVASKLASRLEQLSWIVPDPSRQSGKFGGTWYRDTGILLDSLCRYSPNLKILRICVEGSFYEGHKHYGELINAFRMYLARLRSLDTFEIHLTSRSPWLGSEIIHALPSTVKYLYVSDNLISIPNLVRVIAGRFIDDIGDDIHSAITTKTANPETDELITTGDDPARKDGFKIRVGRLSFVTTEYSNPKYDIDLLVLNYRLLDRERNSHLSQWEGKFIPPRYRSTPSDIEDENFLTEPKDWQWQRGEILHNVSFLKTICFTRDATGYFGAESEAEKVFAREESPKLEQLPQLKWPVVMEVGDNERHWMCDGR